MALVAALSLGCSPPKPATPTPTLISDEALVKTLAGFAEGSATVNGIRLHYVAGGKGPAVILLPGWPETWWSYHKIMPELARTHRVIAVDLRGMGRSDKPTAGYDKKTMASDIAELVRQLGLTRIDLVGHDIGAMVAFSFAANHPDRVRKLVMLDVGHPSAGWVNLKLLPEPGTFGERVDEEHVYLWWFAFHQVKGMPEELLEGRSEIEQRWFFRYMARDEAAIDERDRAVYASAYSSRDAIRAGNAWYQAFGRDIADDGGYGPLTMPVLGLGGTGFNRLKPFLDTRAPGSRTIRIEGSGHFLAEEKPAAVLEQLHAFLDGESQ